MIKNLKEKNMKVFFYALHQKSYKKTPIKLYNIHKTYSNISIKANTRNLIKGIFYSIFCANII